MEKSHISSTYYMPDASQMAERPEDYLSPEQRLEAIAKILATIGLRALRNKHEHDNQSC